MPEYIIIGCLGIDHIIFEDGRQIPPQPGGDAFYAAAGARLWGVDVGIASKIPKGYPQDWIDKLSNYGVDTTGIVRTKESFGLDGTITYKVDGSRVISASGGALKFIQDKFPKVIEKIAYPLWNKVCPTEENIPVSYLTAKAAFIAAASPASQSRCLKALSGKVDTILIDPAPLIPGTKHGTLPPDLPDFSLTDFVLPSEQECNEYWGDGISPDEASEQFFKIGARSIALKLGASGARIYAGKNVAPVTIPVYKTNVVDSTGAGDSFGGGFMVGLMETGDPYKAACYGAVSASFIIEGFGADHALKVYRDQAVKRLKVLLSSIK
jgi:ribokinase